MLDESGKMIVRVVPKSIQLPRIPLMNSDDTTAILRFKDNLTDEKLWEWLIAINDANESAYSFASQYLSDSVDPDDLKEFYNQINNLVLKYRNMAKYRLLLTKSRDGTMLGLTKTTKTVSQSIENSVPQPLPNLVKKNQGETFTINPEFERDFKGKSFF